MATLFDNVGFTPTAGGTTDWTYSAAVQGYQTPATAGVTGTVKYHAFSADRSQWEIGEGAYSGGVLARTTVLYNSSGTGTLQGGAGTKISFSVAPTVIVVALKADLLGVDYANSFTATQKAQARQNIGVLTPPQGRLTLASGTPVMTTNQSAKTTLYYALDCGNQIPIYDGTALKMMEFSEISAATTDTSKNPAAIGASKVNDWFVWDDSGTLRLTHGPDWTNDSTRSAGTALTAVNGIKLNSVAITNGPAASRGTWVGTTRSNGSSQLDWIFGGLAVGGTAAFFYVWNAYNRRDVASISSDSTNSWTLAATSTRSANNSTAMRASFVCGAQEDEFYAGYFGNCAGGSGSGQGAHGVGFDSTSVFSGLCGYNSRSDSSLPVGGQYATTTLGAHYFQALESAQIAGTATFVGDAGVSYHQNGLIFRGRM